MLYTSPTSLRALLAERGMTLSKSRGQNFLIDKNILQAILGTADIGKNDTVVEVGPGLGVVTQELVKRVERVFAVEYDKKFGEFLRERFENESRLTLIEGDILKTPNSVFGTKPYTVVANLPYNITSAVLQKFLTEDPRPEKIIVMVQKEVAERIIASEGDTNLLSLSVALYGSAKIIKKVSPGSFWPRPNVWSAILKITVGKNPFTNVEEEHFFWKVAKAGFSAKRKKLSNNITSVFDLKKPVVERVFATLGFSSNIRAQELEVEEWEALARLIRDWIKKKE